VYNVGRPEEISINRLAERVTELAGSSSSITHVPYEEVYGPGFEDMKRRTPDITKLQDTIDFAPSHSLEDILRDVIAERKETSDEAEQGEHLRSDSVSEG
jgi:UDP-glucose 4-epimerase